MNKFTLSAELTSHILEGGTVIKTENYIENHIVGLVRMPKGKFIDGTLVGQPDTTYEYMLVSTRKGDGVLKVNTYFNDSLAYAKKMVSTYYHDTAYLTMNGLCN